MVKFFHEFFPDAAIVESVKAAKDYLKSQALQSKKKTDGPEATLTPQEIKTLESDPNFIEIKNLCARTPSLTYTFTKFFYDDLKGMNVDERFNVLNGLMQDFDFLKSKKLKLPIPFEQYATLKKEKGDGPLFRIQKLEADIKELTVGSNIKSFINKLLPFQKTWFKDLNQTNKSEVSEIASKMAKLSPGIQNLFFKKVKRYKSIEEMFSEAKRFIKSSGSSLFENLAYVDENYGEGQYEEVYDGNGIMIFNIKTFKANKVINGNTSHCIASRQSSWDDYVTVVTKQYYIYDLNLPPDTNWSVIGVTMKVDGTMTAAHRKDDQAVSREAITDNLKRRGIKFEDVLTPPTQEEVDFKQRARDAKEKICQKETTLEEIKEYISLGADKNESYGTPLKNALSEGAIDKIKYLLEIDALSDFITNDWDYPRFISNKESLELILETLQRYESTLPPAGKGSVEDQYLKVLKGSNTDLEDSVSFFREKLSDLGDFKIYHVIRSSDNLEFSMKVFEPFLNQLSNHHISELLYIKEEQILPYLKKFLSNFTLNDFRYLLSKRFDRIPIFDIVKPYLDSIEVVNLDPEEVDKLLGSSRINYDQLEELFIKFQNYIGPLATTKALTTFSEIPEGLSLDMFTNQFDQLESEQIWEIISECRFLEEIKDELKGTYGELYSSDIITLLENFSLDNVQLILPDLKPYIGDSLSNEDAVGVLKECDSRNFFTLLEILSDVVDEFDTDEFIELISCWCESSDKITKELFRKLNTDNFTIRHLRSFAEANISPTLYISKFEGVLKSLTSRDSYTLFRIIRSMYHGMDWDDWDLIPLNILDSDDAYNLLRWLSDTSIGGDFSTFSVLIPKLSDNSIDELLRYNHRDYNYIEMRADLLEEMAKRAGELNLERGIIMDVFFSSFETEGDLNLVLPTLKIISKNSKEPLIGLLKNIYNQSEDVFDDIVPEFVSNGLLTNEDVERLRSEIDEDE